MMMYDDIANDLRNPEPGKIMYVRVRDCQRRWGERHTLAGCVRAYVSCRVYGKGFVLCVCVLELRGGHRWKGRETSSSSVSLHVSCLNMYGLRVCVCLRGVKAEKRERDSVVFPTYGATDRQTPHSDC